MRLLHFTRKDTINILPGAYVYESIGKPVLYVNEIIGTIIGDLLQKLISIFWRRGRIFALLSCGLNRGSIPTYHC